MSRSLRHLPLLVLAIVWLGAVSTAQAGGIEYAGQGARGLARGGANMAKAEDSLVLVNNPAGLVELRGTSFNADFQMGFMKACIEPIGYYGWGAYPGSVPFELTDPETGEVQTFDISGSGDEVDYFIDALDTVCLSHAATPLPNAGWTTRVNDWFGIGFGLMFPAAVPMGSWGGEDGVVRNEEGILRPSPVRYQQLNSGTLGVFPTLGVGFKLFEQLRLGASFQWQIIAVHTELMAAVSGGTGPGNEVKANISATDWFVPAVTLSAHLVPVDAVDVVVAFKWSDSIDASGDINLTSGLYHTGLDTYETTGLVVDSVQQGMPWKLSAGVRYAHRLAPRPSGDGSEEGDEMNDTRIRDAMSEELWDVEVDVEYWGSSQVQETVLTPMPNQFFYTKPKGSDQLSMVAYPRVGMPQNIVQRQWQDQVAVQLGGSYNILPGVFSLHGGAHYETRGANPTFMQVDFWPLQRLGLHTGITVRLDQRIDFTFSYAHIFQETLAVASPPHGEAIDGGHDKRVGPEPVRGQERPIAEEQNAPVSADGVAGQPQQITVEVPGQPAYITNSGYYSSQLDVIAVGLDFHF